MPTVCRGRHPHLQPQSGLLVPNQGEIMTVNFKSCLLAVGVGGTPFLVLNEYFFELNPRKNPVLNNFFELNPRSQTAHRPSAAAQIQTTQQLAKEKPRQETTSNLLKTLFTAFTKELNVVKVEHHIELSWGV